MPPISPLIPISFGFNRKLGFEAVNVELLVEDEVLVLEFFENLPQGVSVTTVIEIESGGDGVDGGDGGSGGAFIIHTYINICI
ncbi:hypothetical protein Hanom_Chr09g00829411 [Helianthus anomalus]